MLICASSLEIEGVHLIHMTHDIPYEHAPLSRELHKVGFVPFQQVVRCEVRTFQARRRHRCLNWRARDHVHW